MVALSICLSSVAVATFTVLAFLLVPVSPAPPPVLSTVVLAANASRALYRNVRVTNVTGQPGRGAHWVYRNEPYRIYQAPSRGFVTLFTEAGAQWRQHAGGHQVLGSVVESARTFDNAELERTDATGTNFVARANLQYVGDYELLGVTRLIMDETMKHIYQWGIILNAGVPNLCDAVHNESCYDLRSVVVHEVGHVYGLDDLDNPQCYRDVMYQSLTLGETRGRQLDQLTSACVASLYSNLPVEGEYDEDNFMPVTAADNVSSTHRLELMWWVPLHLILYFLV